MKPLFCLETLRCPLSFHIIFSTFSWVNSLNGWNAQTFFNCLSYLSPLLTDPSLLLKSPHHICTDSLVKPSLNVFFDYSHFPWNCILPSYIDSICYFSNHSHLTSFSVFWHLLMSIIWILFCLKISNPVTLTVIYFRLPSLSVHLTGHLSTWR